MLVVVATTFVSDARSKIVSTVIGSTPGWLRYRLPRRFIRQRERPVCLGQKQVWFLLRLVGREADVNLAATDEPEFDLWRWVDFWYPATHVVSFKRQVYEKALKHLEPLAQAHRRPREVEPEVAPSY